MPRTLHNAVAKHDFLLASFLVNAFSRRQRFLISALSLVSVLACDTLAPSDGGVASSDAGSVSSDGGVVSSDAGSVSSDAGVVSSDAGSVSSDAGVVSSDAGSISSDGGVVSSDAGSVSSDAGALTSPTWHQDVAPILAANCQNCHVEEGIAPFPLMNYEQAAPLSDLISYYTAERIMPPFLADNSGDCNTFKNARWLTAGEMATLAAWDEAGAPEGTPTPAPAPAPIESMVNPSVTLAMTEVFTPDATLPDEYRCFIVDPGNIEDVYLTAHEVVPGVAKQVHHMILYKPTSASAQAEAEALSGQDGRPGYTCFGDAKVSAMMMAAWAPGMGVQRYPEGTGVRIEAGRKMVMQVHYNTANGVEADNTRIRIQTAASVAKEGLLTIVNKGALNIEPNVAEFIESNTEVIGNMAHLSDVPEFLWPSLELTLHGIFPHQHELGTGISLSYIRDEIETCLIDVPRWDFNWQIGYFYEEPIVLNAADSLNITCKFDSRGRTEVTNFGEGTDDEMCLAIVYVTVNF